MDDKQPNTTRKPDAVPYIVYETELARQERHIKRLWIALIVAIIVAIIACVAIFAGHIWYLNQYDFASYEQDGQGVNIIGDGNGVDYDVPTLESANQEEPQDGTGESNP